MTLPFLLEIAWKSSLTLGLTLAALALLRHRSAAERSWIAHAGLAATLLLPLVIWAAPRWQVEAPAPVTSILATTAPVPAPLEAPLPPEPGNASPATPATPDPPADSVIDAGLFSQEPAVLAYAIPAALLLGITLLAILRLFALRGRANVLVEQSWLTALARAQQRMGFKHGTALLVSDDIASPVSWGVLRPVILLNDAAVGSHDQAEAIIAHELAHVARFDWAKLLLARITTAIFWFNPLAWLLARQCHQLREEAADDSVLASDVPDIDYAELLVGVARHESGALLLAANGVAPGKGSLLRRVERVLDAGLRRAPPRAAWTTACAVAALMITTPLAALSLSVGGSATTEGVSLHFSAATGNAAPVAPPRVMTAHRTGAPDEITDALDEARTAVDAAMASAPLVASAAASAAASLGDPASLPSFSAISLQGGGEVIVRYGPNRSVRTISGNPRIAVTDDNVAVGGNGMVEVVMPRLEAIAIRDGGSVTARGTFPPVRDLATAISNGGSIDVQAIEAAEVAAAVKNGGTIKTRVRNELAANVSGGGSILYWGNPHDVASATNKGGTIQRVGN